MGGSVLTVQADLDFINDFGLVNGQKNPPTPSPFTKIQPPGILILEQPAPA
jgi:hypothetical protein